MRAAAAWRRPAGGEPTLWTPAQIATVLWFDASDSASITIATGVSQWNDKSGNDYHLVQATTSEQPAVLSEELNGLDVVSFDGSSDYLWNHDSALRDAWRNVGYGWTIAIYKKTGDDAAGANRNLLVGTGGAGATRMAPFIGRNNDASYYNAPTVQSERVDGSGNFLRFPSSAGSSYDAYVLAAWDIRWADDEAYLFADGAAAGSDSGKVGAGNTSNTTSNGALVLGAYPTSVGANPNAANHADMDLCEVVAGNTELTTTNRQLLEGYLAWKWGLEANLPGGHPYKDAPPTV
jgi:hypothetical protein